MPLDAASPRTPPQGPPPGLPASDIALFDDDVLRDPYPAYAALRALGPVVWLSRYGMAMLTRHAEVKAALADWRSFSSAGGVTMNPRMNETLSGGLLCSDPPRHDALRRVIERPVAPRALNALRARVNAEAEALVARLCDQGEIDLMTDLAPHLPVSVVSDLVGLPEEGRERMLVWAPANFDCFGPEGPRTEAAFPIVGEMVDYAFTQCVPGKLKPGGWAQMIWDAAHAGEVALEDAPHMMNDYLGPALDTTIFATGWLFWLLSRHPAQWEALRANPAMIPAAINEAVRLRAPIQNFSRLVARDVEIGGRALPAGTRVVTSYGSANRCERRWEDPDAFDILRDGSEDHLGFGHGEHNCVGKNLARLEIRALLCALLPRVARIEPGPFALATNSVLHGLKSARVTLHPA